MIKKPTLLLDEEKCIKNINRMFLKANKNNLIFRPHFKTHQSLQIGQLFKNIGVDKITVSSVEMAKYFSSEWDDITIAFPVNILEINEINQLAANISINILLESKESALFMKERLLNNVGVFIKIDTGYHRTGIESADSKIIDDICSVIDSSTTMSFKGFLAHSGNTYNAKSKEEVVSIHNKSREIMASLKAKYIVDYPSVIISLGDTPSCSIAEDFKGIDEIRPGNFVFYDLVQNSIGACSIDQIAVSVACPIVAINNNRNEIVIYGGGVHFSKERLQDKELGVIFGKVVESKDSSWGKTIDNMYLKSISQEHGVISVPETLINKYKIGDILIILPVHSCMTANCMEYYFSKSKIIEKF